MVHKLVVLISGAVLGGALLAVGPPAQAHHPHGDVYSAEHFDNPYAYTDDSCDGLPFDVSGRATGYEVIYNVPESEGQAFLDDNRYQYHEVWTNPANGRKAYVSGRAHFREVKAEHVDGDVWRFVSVTTGKPFVVKNDKGHTVLAEWGRLVLSSTFDTLGDSQPGGEPLGDEILSARGNWPTWEEDFDFCALVDRVLG
jgi:hypothetical protein